MLKSKRDDIEDKEDIINLLRRVNGELRERPQKLLDINLMKEES